MRTEWVRGAAEECGLAGAIVRVGHEVRTTLLDQLTHVQTRCRGLRLRLPVPGRAPEHRQLLAAYPLLIRALKAHHQEESICIRFIYIRLFTSTCQGVNGLSACDKIVELYSNLWTRQIHKFQTRCRCRNFVASRPLILVVVC